MEIAVLLVWLILCGTAGYIAENKGRSGVGVFFLSFFLSPLVGVIVALGMTHDEKKMAAAQGKKKCPSCAEFVQPDAKTCRFCQHSFVEEEATERTRLAAEWERLEAERARQQAEYKAAQAARPWLQRKAGPLIILVFIAFVGVLTWYGVRHPMRGLPASENKPSVVTRVMEKRSKVPKLVWDKRVAWAVQHHCYLAAMSRDEIVQALGKPTEEQSHDLTYKRPSANCAHYEPDGNACVEYETDERIIFLADGYEDSTSNSSDSGCRTLYGEHQYTGFEVPSFGPRKARQTRSTAEAWAETLPTDACRKLKKLCDEQEESPNCAAWKVQCSN